MHSRDAGGAETHRARLHDSVCLLGQSLNVSRGRTSKDATRFHGQLGEEESTEEGLGISIEGLHVAEEAGRLSIPETRQGQELHVLGSLSLTKGADEGSLQRIIFVVHGRRQDDGLDFSCCDIVQSSDNMVKLGQVCCDGRAAGCELGLHLAEPHLWPRGPEGRKLDRDR